ncbi:non-ribosomal peptide synthetase [Amycolatopsis tolypomycina]|uniref:non-ribosomal peptide synthetase n=1 Tax=Amycolatopsis tolypomycina TaxID=208445 RepID=UPI0033AE39BA
MTTGNRTSMIAASAILVHRRTLQEQVTIAYAETVPKTVTVDFSAAPSFRAVCDFVASSAVPGESDETDVDAVVRFAPDGSVDGDPAELARLRALITDGVAHPDRPVSELRLTTGDDLAWLETVSGDERPPRPARCVHDVFADHAAATPDAVAISCAGRTLTYRDLHERAAGLAAALHGAGARPGEVVAVFGRRSPELVTGLLAILRAGCAYLALDPDDPPARHELLLRDAQAAVLLVDPAMVAPAGFTGAVVPWNARADQPVDVEVTPDHLAYVSYTSGSTGVPKGVAVPHRAISRLVVAPNWIEVVPGDVVLESAPVAFDASTVEIWTALLNGARLAILPPGPVELDRLADAVRAENVTVLLLTTGLFHHMVTAQLDCFKEVRHVLTGGDVVSPRHVKTLLDAHPHLVFTNGYGPTENTSFTTCWTIRAPLTGGSVPIGPVVSGTTLAILDPRLHPVPVGVCGEMYAGGEGVATGYLGRPKETAARFVPDPFSRRAGARMYRTGDLARWLPDGTVEFVGRIDTQVKVRGHRVEPGELEAELARRPEVAQAVVVAQPDASNGHRLLTYVVPAGPGDHAGLGARLRDRVARTLPSYLVPWAVLVVDELPLTRNGKVDRRALPAVTRSPRVLASEYVAPDTALETSVAEIWGELLGVEPVGIDDDFFELGGHSLLAADLLGIVRRRFGIDVAARTLYLGPTVRELAAAMGAEVPS